MRSCQLVSFEIFKLANMKYVKIIELGEFINLIFLKDVFGLAEHQQIPTCGLEFKRTLQNNSAKYVLNHGPGADDAANGAKERIIQKSDIRCYVPFFTPVFSRQIFLLVQNR